MCTRTALARGLVRVLRTRVVVVFPYRPNACRRVREQAAWFSRRPKETTSQRLTIETAPSRGLRDGRARELPKAGHAAREPVALPPGRDRQASHASLRVQRVQQVGAAPASMARRL